MSRKFIAQKFRKRRHTPPPRKSRIELDADYFAAMENRFQAHIAKPVLFAPEQMYKFEQPELFTPENLETT